MTIFQLPGGESKTLLCPQTRLLPNLLIGKRRPEDDSKHFDMPLGFSPLSSILPFVFTIAQLPVFQPLRHEEMSIFQPLL